MLNNTQQTLLIALFALWAALLFGGFIFGKPWADGSRRMPVWTRMGSSLMLVIAAWGFWGMLREAFAPFSIPAEFRTDLVALAFAVGMTLGLLGDLFMARLIIKNDTFLYGGIGAFACGHIAYLVGMLTYANANSAFTQTLWVAWGVFIIIGWLGWVIVVYPSREPAVTRFAALPYTLLLASTAGVASGLALQTPLFMMVALGAALFLLSDLILAAGMFRKWRFRLIDDVVWLTYGPGQMLIVYGMLLTGVFMPTMHMRGLI